MILLTATTHSLELQTSTSQSLDWTVGYVDITTTTFTADSGQGNVASATTTTIVAAPAASTQRQVKMITAVNRGTTSNTITIKKDVSGTERVLFVASLAAGESVNYIDGSGFCVRDVAGREKMYNSDSPGTDGKTVPFYKIGGASEAVGVWHTLALVTGTPGAWAPGTPGLDGRATDGTTAGDGGCVPVPNPAAGGNFLTGVVTSATVAHQHWLMDVLWVNSGIVVTTTTAQAIASVALPARDINGTANGIGCMVGLLVSAATTNVAAITNTTLNYTNSAGTAGRTATMTSFPATAVEGTVVWFNLQAGDNGIQSIQGITLGTSYVTGTIHIIVARPVSAVACFTADIPQQAPINPSTGVRLYSGVCLLPFYVAASTSATTISGALIYMER